MGDVFKKYANLLTAGSYVTLVPALQEDWLAIFRQPWIPTALGDPIAPPSREPMMRKLIRGLAVGGAKDNPREHLVSKVA